MKKVMNQPFLFLSLIGASSAVNAQSSNESFVNQGQISVASGGVVSTLYDFDNQAGAKLSNDGTVYYYRDFNNDGYYSFTTNRKTGKAVFTRYAGEGELGAQLISGSEMSEFHDVELNNATKKKAFDLKNNMEVYGTVDFQDGIIKVDPTVLPGEKLSQGMLSFQQGAKAINVKDASHAEGLVEKIGNESFQYPKGDQEKYRYARISAPELKTDGFVGEYRTEDAAFFKARPTTAGVIKELNTSEYWLIDRGNETKSDILLTLSWDERTTLPAMLVDPENELHIARWDAQQQLWVDEGGVVDMSSKEITTVSAVKGYGFFTLATVKKDWI
ncbi:gliding motility-associated C-terminal domain-containing protein, partial [Myroides sp. WP-1]|uniref:gliding motility-associated C-terminal domain-containing protein n=1 Tax=Myroides sp. WP-1 TaxID=2759944 RepID=UPI0015FAD33B